MKILVFFLLILLTFSSWAGDDDDFDDDWDDDFEFPTISLIPYSHLHFGEIIVEAGSKCKLDINANVSGDCNSANSNISLGEFELDNFAADTEYFLTIKGDFNAHLDLYLEGAVSVNGNQFFLNDGETMILRTGDDEERIFMKVFGQLYVSDNLEPNQPYNVDYTIDITFQ